LEHRLWLVIRFQTTKNSQNGRFAAQMDALYSARDQELANEWRKGK
jgi:hypothetical protein